MSTLNKQAALVLVAGAVGAVLCAIPIAVERSAEAGIALSGDQAHAIIGRPATPGSVAGVHRRTDRRVVRRHVY